MNSGDINPQLLYQSLLAETDQEAKHEYEVDPRVAQYALRNTNDDREVPGYELPENHAPPFQHDPLYTKVTEEERVEYEAPLFEQPNLVPYKRVVIIDTAQRDWTVQPDAYSNVFGFGDQNPNTVTATTQTPYYYNNPTVPYAAYDMPTYNGIGTPPAQRANNKPMLMKSESLNTVQYGLLANTWGWRLVRSRTTGQLVHSDVTPGAADDPVNYTTVYFPVYDSTQTRGARIGYDTQIPDPGDLVNTFSTQYPLSNIGSIRLVRATLPVRKFDTFNPNVFIAGNPSGVTFLTTTALTSTATANLLNTFHSEPYLLMSIGSLQGNYLGANQCIQNSFTALVQKQRITLDGNGTTFLSQFQDYFPWSEEAYTFDPPLSYLSNADITITNQLGTTFSHIDDLYMVNIFIGLSSTAVNPSFGPAYGNPYFGTIQFLINHGSNVSLSATIFSSNYAFSINDVRTGDELVMYQPVLQQILQDTKTTSQPALQTFMSNLATHNLIVTSVNSGLPTFGDPLNPTFANDSVIVGYAINAAFKYSNLADMYSITSNFLDLETAGLINIPLTPPFLSNIYGSNNYSIPFLNRMMQCTYAFEVVTMEPDTSGLGKIVAL